MSLRIQNNLEAFNAHRSLTSTANLQSKSMEKLSSGFRINRASDDAAGLAISQKLSAQVSGLDQACRIRERLDTTDDRAAGVSHGRRADMHCPPRSVGVAQPDLGLAGDTVGNGRR